MTTNYYDNKGKNLFVMFSIIAVLIFNILNTLISVYNTTEQKFQFSQLIKYHFSDISWLFLFFLPHILLLFYALIVFTNLKIKNWLLSIYFLALSISFAISLYDHINSIFSYSDSHILYELYFEALFGCLLTIGCVCLFIGSINNFAFKKFFKAGVVFWVIYCICNVVTTINIIISTGRILINRNSPFPTMVFFYTNQAISLLLFLSYICFLVSLVFLTTRKQPAQKQLEK